MLRHARPVSSPLAAILLGLTLAGPAAAQGGGQRIHVDVESADLGDVMREISRRGGGSVLVGPDVQEVVSVSLRDIPWREAVDVIARMTRCEVEELPGGILYLTQTPRVTLAGTDLAAASALHTIAKQTWRPVLVLPGVVGRIAALDLVEVPWRQALEEVAALSDAEVRELGGVVVVAPRGFADPPAALVPPATEPFTGGEPVDVEAQDEGLADVCERLGRAVGKNVLVDPNVTARVSVHLQDVPWRDAVNALARLTRSRLEVRQNDLAILRPLGSAMLVARGAPLGASLGLLAEAAGVSVAIGAGVGGQVTVDLLGVEPLDAARLLAWAHGLTVEEEGEVLRVTAPDVPLGGDDAIGRLSRAIEEAARRGDAEGVEASARALAELVRGETAVTDLPPLDPAPGAEPSSDQGRAPAPGERPGGGAATAKRVELLFREIVALAEERQVEELVERFAELRQLMDELGAEGTAEVRAKLGRYAKELEGLGEVRLSIQLQVYINEGNQLLREMAAAIREEELARVEGLFLKVEAVVGDMRDEEREVFHRNAEALLLRAQSLRERAAVLARAFEHPVELGAVLSRRPGTGEPNLALINGQVHQEGDPVRDAQGRETPVRVVAVSTSTVRLRFDDTEFVRALTD